MNSHLRLLLVEDNPADVRLALEAFAERQLFEVYVARDGIEALQFLSTNRATPREPNLILLDLNLPRLHGREVLEALKRDDATRHIPVIVMTTSTSQKDINDSYQRHASGYIIKPRDVGQFFEIMNKLEDFFLHVLTLPGNFAHTGEDSA